MIAGTGPERHGIYRDAATNVLNSEATRRWVTEQTRIDRLMAEVTDAALTAAAPKPGENVLDIGCGTCTTTLRQAQAVRPTGRVLGIDISEQQLGLARQRVAAAPPTMWSLCWTTPRHAAFRQNL
jgi:2-polyprenyl-3-methyl-5-hydroxy-6-metoxy-1,4-benzoquinol methylase